LCVVKAMTDINRSYSSVYTGKSCLVECIQLTVKLILDIR